MTCLTVTGSARTYPRVYFDYVIEGVVRDEGFVNDGYRSYHLVSPVPKNTYWELKPCDRIVEIRDRRGIFRGWFIQGKRWVFYGKTIHHLMTKHEIREQDIGKPVRK